MKEPDGWGRVADELRLSTKTRRRLFEFGEYADIELVLSPVYGKNGVCGIDIVGGRIVPRRNG